MSRLMLRSFVAAFLIGFMSLSALAMDNPTHTLKFETEHELKAIALVVHGLNTKPMVMKDVIDMLNAQGITCLLAQLSGHRNDDGLNMTAENWLNDWRQAFTQTQDLAREKDVRFFVVGHSMGCLVNSCHLASTNDQSGLAGCIYFAPADGLRPKLRTLLPLASNPIMKALLGDQLEGVGTMFAGSNAAQANLPLCAFSALDTLFMQAKSSDPRNVPTICFVDPADMLIDAQYLLDNLGLRENSWTILKIASAGEADAHMCILKSHPGFHQIGDIIAPFITDCLGSNKKEHLPAPQISALASAETITILVDQPDLKISKTNGSANSLRNAYTVEILSWNGKITEREYDIIRRYIPSVQSSDYLFQESGIIIMNQTRAEKISSGNNLDEWGSCFYIIQAKK